MKKHTATYASTLTNPFRTLPKDAPARGSGKEPSGHRGNQETRGHQNNFGGNIRGGRTPGYNAPRGGNYNMNGNNFNNNRNFAGPAIGSGNMAGGFNPNMVGFQGNPSQFGGFNRGAMMGQMRSGPGGMRGRGGMGNMMMPMNVPLGAMPGSMGGPMGGISMMGQMGGMPGIYDRSPFSFFFNF